MYELNYKRSDKLRTECADLMKLGGVKVKVLAELSSVNPSDMGKFMREEIYFSDVVLNRIDKALDVYYETIKNIKNNRRGN